MLSAAARRLFPGFGVVGGGLHFHRHDPAQLRVLWGGDGRYHDIANHLEQLPEQEGRQESDIVLGRLPPELRSMPGQVAAPIWTTQPQRLRQLCMAAVRDVTAVPARAPSLRLLADRTAEALLGISGALNGLAVLVDGKLPAGPQGGSS